MNNLIMKLTKNLQIILYYNLFNIHPLPPLNNNKKINSQIYFESCFIYTNFN